MPRLVPERWKHPLERLREDIHQAFDRWMPELRARMPQVRSRRRGEEEGFPSGLRGFPPGMMWYSGPSVDVEESEHEVLVYAELPGLERDDFTVEVLGDQLFLRGEKKASAEEKRQTYYYSECSYGSFVRRISLPSEVNADQAKAEYKHGLLKISLPKVEQPEARKITIKAS